MKNLHPSIIIHFVFISSTLCMELFVPILKPIIQREALANFFVCGCGSVSL